MITENFYVRGDGTVSTKYCFFFFLLDNQCFQGLMLGTLFSKISLQCSFYFTEDFLSNLFLGAGFLTADMSIYQKQIENRSRSVTMDRYFSLPFFILPTIIHELSFWDNILKKAGPMNWRTLSECSDYNWGKTNITGTGYP